MLLAMSSEATAVSILVRDWIPNISISLLRGNIDIGLITNLYWFSSYKRVQKNIIHGSTLNKLYKEKLSTEFSKELIPENDGKNRNSNNCEQKLKCNRCEKNK